MLDQADHPAPAATAPPKIFCRKCGYALLGLQSGNCPECGREFDPACGRTFARRPPRGWVWRWTRRVALLILVVVLFASGGLGWLWWGWQGEQKTIDQLETVRAHVEVKVIGPEWLQSVLGSRFGYITQRVEDISLFQVSADDIATIDFTSLAGLESVRLNECYANERIFAKLYGVKTLRWLTLYAGQPYHPNLGFLTRVPQVRILFLGGKGIDNAALKHIAKLKRLTQLCLADVAVTDQGLEVLKDLPALERLQISEAAITDAGLQRLKGPGKLRDVLLSHTQITRAGIARLREEMPGLDIEDMQWGRN